MFAGLAQVIVGVALSTLIWTVFVTMPYVAVSSAFDRSSGVADFGFAIDAWRPNPYFSATDVNDVPVSNIFTGIDADVAVRNTNATMHRVSYHITIIGRIAFLLTR